MAVAIFAQDCKPGTEKQPSTKDSAVKAMEEVKLIDRIAYRMNRHYGGDRKMYKSDLEVILALTAEEIKNPDRSSWRKRSN